MIQQFLKWGAWSDVKELLSPRFFEVMSTRKIVTLLRELYGHYGDDEAWEQASSAVEELARRGGVDLEVVRDIGDGADPSEGAGDLALRLYFAQLFHGETTLLDLRRQGFREQGESWLWSPTALMIEWDEDFQRPMRQIYRGFYQGDDQQFRRGLEALDLLAVEGLFRKHFGEDHQRAVTFFLDEFKATFHEILSKCKREGISLHHQFGALGIYLACLYDHLEELGGSFDVEAAVKWALALDGEVLDERRG